LIELALGRLPFSSDEDDRGDDSDLREMDMTHRGPGNGDGEERTAQRESEGRKTQGVSLGGGGMTMSIFDLLHHIVNEPAPRLVDSVGGRRFPIEAQAFVERCLQKDPELRANPKELLVRSGVGCPVGF
jgi:mitogen-activated protein kinase kinase